MKSNIEIVKDYLAGVRPVTQVGYTGQEYVRRVVGERWIDKSGQEWEQKGCGPQKVNRVANLIREAIGVEKCRCGQEINYGSRADHLFFRKTGLCEACLIDYETKLRVLGNWAAMKKARVLKAAVYNRASVLAWRAAVLALSAAV